VDGCVSLVLQKGFVNGLAFAQSGRFLAAAVGQEHRLGRWWSHKAVKNGLALVKLPLDMPKAAAPKSKP
jgi:ribosomal RNA-processing protein 9